MPEGLLPNPENENLIPFSEVVSRAKRAGVGFGKGDPNNRFRYYTKIGLLPHAKRKSFGAANPVGAYPESVVERLIQIDGQLRDGKSVQQLLREQRDDTEKRGQKGLEGLPAGITITPIPQIKPPPERPHVQVPKIGTSPPSEELPALQEPGTNQLKPAKSVLAHPLTLGALTLATVLAGPLLYFLNTDFRNNTNDILSYLTALNPKTIKK